MPLSAPEAYQYAQTFASIASCCGSRLLCQAPIQASTLTMHTSTTISATISTTGTRTLAITSRWPAFAALFMGLIVLYAVAFSPYSRAHNAAHDTRHSNGFPCH
jgi:cobalt transporter subunit CbtB